MRLLTRAQREERAVDLETVARELGVRKVDVRTVVSALHAQGFVDALRLRPTLLGLTLGTAVLDERLAPLRRSATALVKAA